MSFLAPAAAWMFLLLAPLVLLHMLKLKRPPRRVPSLVLWQRTLQDERVNAPLRRLRPDLLFWLQVALLLALALAAMQPLFGTRALGESLVVVLDRSASMAATDPTTGRPRLDDAKDRARALAAEHAGSDVAVVAFARGAELVQPFTSDSAQVARAVGAVEVEDVGDDLAAALRLVAALGSQRELHRVVLVSDGSLPDVADFGLPFALAYERVGSEAANLGITRLAARREGASTWRIFAAVAGNEGGTARLQVEVDGTLRHESVVAPAADAPERIELALDVPDDGDHMLVLRLAHAGFDALASDDGAFLVLPRGRPLRVRVDADLDGFVYALAACEDLVFDATVPPDLVIAKAATGTPEAPLSLTVGGVPPALAGIVEVAQGEGRVVDQDRLDPLLAHVELQDLLLLDDVRWLPDQSDATLERAGHVAIVHGVHGPLLVRHRTPLGDRTAYAMLFDPARSTLPYRVAFPVLIGNLVTMARDLAGLRDVTAPRTGTLPLLGAAAGATAVVVGPDGERTTVRAGDDGVLAGGRAPRAGVYEIDTGSAPPRRIGVSLLDPRETRLAAQQTLMVGDLSIPARPAAAGLAASFWPAVVGCALLLACLEWWLFRRARRRLLA